MDNDPTMVAIRERTLGEVLPALVEEIYRLSAKAGSKKGGSAGCAGYKPFAGPLEMKLCAFVKVRLLQECTALHKRLGMGPLSVDKGGPQLLFQLPASEVVVEEHANFLQVRLSKSALKSMKAAVGCDFSAPKAADTGFLKF
eukprot:s1396_g5.t1